MAEQTIHSVRPILYEMSGNIRQEPQSSTADLDGRHAGEKINTMCPLQIYILSASRREYTFPTAEHALSPYLLYVYKFDKYATLSFRNYGEDTDRDWFVQPLTPLHGNSYILRDIETGSEIETYTAEMFAKYGIMIPDYAYLDMEPADGNGLFFVY